MKGVKLLLHVAVSRTLGRFDGVGRAVGVPKASSSGAWLQVLVKQRLSPLVGGLVVHPRASLERCSLFSRCAERSAVFVFIQRSSLFSWLVVVNRLDSSSLHVTIGMAAGFSRVCDALLAEFHALLKSVVTLSW